MSRRDREDYSTFVRRAGSNLLALPVKRADLEEAITADWSLGGQIRRSPAHLDEEFSGR
jgi:hypothetical protein